jgi:hypothetical protein
MGSYISFFQKFVDTNTSPEPNEQTKDKFDFFNNLLGHGQ